MNLVASELLRLRCEEILGEAREVAEKIARQVEQVSGGVPAEGQPPSQPPAGPRAGNAEAGPSPKGAGGWPEPPSPSRG